MEKTLKYGRYTIEINFGFDMDTDNPRNWAQGILYGVDKPIGIFNENRDEIKSGFWLFPVSKYKHGMVAFYIGNPRKGDFDSGLYGIYAVPKSFDLEEAERLAEVELKEWECFCNGTLYEYHIHDEDSDIDEYCQGFFSEESCEYSALECARYYTERDERDAVYFWARNND